MHKKISILVWILWGLSPACRADMKDPFPAVQGQVPILVLGQQTDDEKDALTPATDFPSGVYQLPKSNVFIADVQGGGVPIAPILLFGLVGVVAASDSGTTADPASSQQAQELRNLTLDTAAITQQSLTEALNAGAGGTRFTLTGGSGDTSLQIFPYMVYSFVGDHQARLWVILKASLVNYSLNKIQWKCRYIAGLGPPRPFQGPGGWESLNSTALEMEAVQDTQEAVRVMMQDLTGSVFKDSASEATINNCWVFYKNPRKVQVKVISNDDREEVVLPQVDDDEYFAGVNIVPKGFGL